jgi:hypothetical protein
MLIAVIAILVKLAPERGVHDAKPAVSMAPRTEAHPEEKEGSDG